MKKLSLALSVLVGFALFACQKEKGTSLPESNGDAISFIVKEAESYKTKSLSDQPSLTFSEKIFANDSADIYLSVNESDYHSDFFNLPAKETKGAPYVNDNIGKFHISAFFNNMELFFQDLELNSNGSAVSTGYYWPITTPATQLNFFAQAKNLSNGQIKNHEYLSSESASFHYTLPDANSANSATNQPDMIFAISPNQVQTGNPVQMNFYHALSALAFSVGSVPGNLRIESVGFKNIYSSGTCTYTHTNQTGRLSFDWSFDTDDTQTEYTQNFEKNLYEDGNVPLPDGTSINTEDQTFMMIPQSFDNDAEIIITISFNGRKYTINKSLKEMTPYWQPGKIYTFKISSPEEVKVEVTDEVIMDGIYPVKQNLQIRNTGFANAYIRIGITGSWVVDHVTAQGTKTHLIIADWKNTGDSKTDDGVFEWPNQEQPAIGQTNSKYWRLGSDGYYYYMKITSPGEILEPLFESYKLTASAPMSDAYLNLSILAQGVLDVHAVDLFPAEIKTALGILK